MDTVELSNDPKTSVSRPYSSTTIYSWTLSAGGGTKVLYFKFKDKAGNYTPVYMAYITVTNPTSSSTDTTPVAD